MFAEKVADRNLGHTIHVFLVFQGKCGMIRKKNTFQFDFLRKLPGQDLYDKLVTAGAVSQCSGSGYL